MKEIKLMLIPQPGAKPEFLATLRVVDPSPAVSKSWEQLVSAASTSSNDAVVILEGYTRDGWAWKPSKELQSLTVQSTDGRNKLSGFVSYLQQRQKACFGRFGGKGVMVVSYVQPKQKGDDAKNRMECRVSLDMTKVPNCNLKPKALPQPARAKPPAKKKGGGGLLSNLVAGQKRTNQHMINASAPTARTVQARSTSSNTEAPANNGAGGAEQQPVVAAAAAAASTGTKTAAEVMNEFRQTMEQKMLDFDIAPDDVLKVPINLSEVTNAMIDEEKPRITMEIMKYMVYEAAEEVNEEWIAHKEPTEFLDEAIIAVYKEGAAPPEVIEELNRGEMPEEVTGEQRHLEQQRMRQMDQAEQKKAKLLESQAHLHGNGDEGGDVAALNQNKRDRRTMEDLERDKKRPRA